MTEKLCDNLPTSDVSTSAESGQLVSNLDQYKNSLFYNRIEQLVNDYEKNAVFVIDQDIDKELLTRNTIALNEFISDQLVNFPIGSGTTETGGTTVGGAGGTGVGTGTGGGTTGGTGGIISPISPGTGVGSGGGSVTPIPPPVSGVGGTGGGSVTPIPPPTPGVGGDSSDEAPESFEELFPNLEERLQALPIITTAEVIDFYSYSKIDPSSFEQYILTLPPIDLLVTLDNFFSPENISTTTMGSFCALVPNIFAQLQSAIDIFNNIQSYAAEFQNIIQKIQSVTLDQVLAAANAALLEALKQQLFSVIDDVVDDIRKKLANYGITLPQKINADYLFNQGSILAKMQTLHSEITEILSEFSIENIKAKIEGMIAYAASTFENLDIEEIQFLILRFCEFISAVENNFNSLLNPLDDLQSSYQNSYTILTSSGNLNTSRAIAAGGIRFNSDELYEGIEQVRNTPASPGRGGNFTEEDPRRLSAKPVRALPPTPEEIEEINTKYTYEQVFNGTDYIFYQPGPTTREQLAKVGLDPSYGWNYVRIWEKVMLIRVAKKWKRRLNILSAFRPLSVNGVDNSLHRSGQAFDIVMSSSEQAIFADIARSESFGPTVYYPTSTPPFIHIDSWTVRTWRTS